MKTSTLTLALLITFFFATESIQAQRSENNREGRGNSTQRTNTRSSSVTNSNRGAANVQTRGTVNRQGSAVNNRSNSRNESVVRKNASVNVTNKRNHGNSNKKVRNTTVINNNTYITTNHGPSMSRRHAVVKKQPVHHTVRVVDHSYTRYRYAGHDYFYRDGYYYKHHNGMYNRCAPTRGLRVGIIPGHYHRVIVASVPYFYFGGIFYRQYEREYEVVAPPVGAIVPELPEYGVSEIVIDGEMYYEFDNVLYKPIVTRDGIQYRVVGNLNVTE